MTHQQSPPADADLERAREIHTRIMVIDAHVDIEIPGRESPYVGDDGRSKAAPDKMAKGGVDAVVLSVASGPGPRDQAGYDAARRRAGRKLAAVKEMLDDPSNGLVLALTADDVVQAKASAKRSIVLGFQNTQIIGADIPALDEFYNEGVRVFALAHIGHNDCADSSRPNFIADIGKHEPDEEHGGLSNFGREAVKRINRLGGLVDVSQTSFNATLQTIELSTTPVIASHSNVRALCDVSRNLSDQEIDAIAANGGVIHVSPFRGYLFDTTDNELVAAIRTARLGANLPEKYLYPFELYWEIKDPEEQLAFTDTISALLEGVSLGSMIDHIDYIAKRIGVEHVGIGTDFNHGAGLKAFDEASDALNVTLALLARGYSENDIDKIWGRNFLRALDAAQSVTSK
jgi:membrane dipeptidase